MNQLTLNKENQMEEITDRQLDIMVDAFESGYHWSEEIRNDLRTRWTLVAINKSICELNQMAMDYGLEGTEFASESFHLPSQCTDCGSPIGSLHMYCNECAPDF